MSLRKREEDVVDLLLPNLSGANHIRTINGDTYFDKISYAPVRSRSALRVFLDGICLRHPPYAVALELDNTLGFYDFIFATPDGFFVTLESIKKMHPNSCALLWINEPYYTVPLGQLLNSLKQGISGLPKALIAMLKLGLIFLHERRYLRRLDGAVVQTRHELARYQALVGENRHCIGFISTNPLKTELLNIERGDERVLLIHAPRSVEEIYSFVTRISICIRESGVDCVVRICVSNVTPYLASFEHLPNVNVIGFQDSLCHVYSSVFLAAVFTRQRYGLVNRVKEAMTAGVAVIAYPESLATLGNIQSGVHAIAAESDEEFINAALLLAIDRGRARYIGQEAREFVLRNEKLGPDQFVEMLSDMVKADESA